MTPFQDFDLSNFWEASDYAREAYTCDPVSDEMRASLETELGYTLPASYISLMKTQNGGMPINTCFPTTEATSWAEDHVAITGIMGIGREKTYAIGGELGSQFMIDEWEYPALGVCVCTCPSAGHDMIMLDYRRCGPAGEPAVVHVDQEFDYRITFLAKDFETFIRGLVHDDVYSTAEEELQNDLLRVNEGNFSIEMSLLMAKYSTINFNEIIRNICRKITLEKGHFSLHADELSNLMYDIQFLLYTHTHGRVRKAQYLEAYPSLIAFGDGAFTTGGYAPSFVSEWLDIRLREKQIVTNFWGGMKLNPAFEASLLEQIQGML